MPYFNFRKECSYFVLPLLALLNQSCSCMAYSAIISLPGKKCFALVLSEELWHSFFFIFGVCGKWWHACWQWQSRWLLGHHCCWGGEWAFWKDGTRATGLKPGWLEMAGLCPNEGQSWGTWEEIKAWWGLQDRYGVCGGRCEVFPSITSLTGCCHIPALSCFCCVCKDHSPHGGSQSSCQHGPSTDHQQALSSPAAQAALGQICQERWYLWLDLLLSCKNTEKLPSFFYLQRSLCLKTWVFFPSYMGCSKKKRFNFLVQSVSIIL